MIQIAVPQLEPGEVHAGRAGARRRLRRPERRLLGHLDRTDLRRADRPHGDHRGDRVAAADLDLHRGPLRVQVRGAGADRARARPPDHRGRVRPVRPGGDDVDGRGAAHDLGLLALRHGDRVRPNPRERAAHAARHLLPDREPLDVRGVHPIAGHELRGADAGGLAAAVRRRHAQGLRVRAARGRGLGRLLVDLHRHPGAGGVEGAREHLHAPPPPRDGGERRRGAAVRLRDDRRQGRRGGARARRASGARPGGPRRPAPPRAAAERAPPPTAVAPPPPAETRTAPTADGHAPEPRRPSRPRRSRSRGRAGRRRSRPPAPRPARLGHEHRRRRGAARPSPSRSAVRARSTEGGSRCHWWSGR